MIFKSNIWKVNAVLKYPILMKKKNEQKTTYHNSFFSLFMISCAHSSRMYHSVAIQIQMLQAMKNAIVIQYYMRFRH